MSRLKNVTAGSVSLQMFHIPAPEVSYISKNAVIVLAPGEDLEESTISVTNVADSSYNADLISSYISQGILTRIPS